MRLRGRGREEGRDIDTEKREWGKGRERGTEGEWREREEGERIGERDGEGEERER